MTSYAGVGNQHIYIDGIEVTLAVPLETIRIEEAVDARALCSFTIQDVHNDITVAGRSDVTIVDTSETVFRGVVVTRTYTQHVPFRVIEVQASDYSILLDERLVGVPSGGIWQGPDDQNNYNSVDPTGRTFGSDAYTIHQWFTYYVSNPTIDATTYVGTYITDYLGEHPLYFTQTTLRSALMELASTVGPNVHFWIDPTLHFHWVAFPFTDTGYVGGGGSLPLDLPVIAALAAAPFGVAEAALVDNSTLYGAHDPPGIRIVYDSTNRPEQVYITGSTDFVYTPDGFLKVTVPIGDGEVVTLTEEVPVVQGGGTGWYPFDSEQGDESNDPNKRQAVATSEASTLAERTADGASAVFYSSRDLIRGTATVRVPTGFVHVGQAIPIRFPTALGVDGSFPVQKVTTQYLDGFGKREIQIDFGDAQLGRLTQRRGQATPIVWKPANGLEVGLQNLNPTKSSSQVARVEVIAPAKLPWSKQFTHTVRFKLIYYRAGVRITTGIPATVSPETRVMDAPGYVNVTVNFTADAQDGDVAFVTAWMED